MNILAIARDGAKKQAILDRMSETFFTNDFLPSFAFLYIPMIIRVQGSKKLVFRPLLSVLQCDLIGLAFFLSFVYEGFFLPPSPLPSPPPLPLHWSQLVFFRFPIFGDLIRALMHLQLISVQLYKK